VKKPTVVTLATASRLTKPATSTDACEENAQQQLPFSAIADARQTQQTNSSHVRQALWYALHIPQLAQLSELQQNRYLEELAQLTLQVSSSISLQPQALVFEIRSSLKYFGGISALHQHLQPAIKSKLTAWNLNDHFDYAASPTATGSLLLAKSGQHQLIYQRRNLRSALGKLPITALNLSKEHHRRLRSMGIQCLTDLWRLPNDGLRKRFGSDFINLLHKASGDAPEPMARYQRAPEFKRYHELPYQLETIAALLPVIDELISQLCEYLRKRDLSVSQLTVSLLHEQQNNTEIPLHLRQPGRSTQQLLLLLETHLTYLALAAPVTAIKLEVQNFDAFISHSEALLLAGKAQEPNYSDNRLNQFMEQLQARLGNNPIRSISYIAEHCPEYASALLDYDESIKLDKKPKKKQTPPTRQSRPFWLLNEPKLLHLRNGKLYYRCPIKILSGPERIETRWWSGKEIRRNYYVAIDEYGSRLWIFRERQGDRNWYLHGVFA